MFAARSWVVDISPVMMILLALCTSCTGSEVRVAIGGQYRVSWYPYVGPRDETNIGSISFDASSGTYLDAGHMQSIDVSRQPALAEAVFQPHDEGAVQYRSIIPPYACLCQTFEVRSASAGGVDFLRYDIECVDDE